MAATRLIPLHINKGKTIAQTIFDRIDYAKNPDKTEGGELVVGYACSPLTVDDEFLLSKREYEYITGRDQGKRNILAYQIRQSFKPGEISPQEALEVGYELAMRFTKGKHAFIVTVHTDKAHIHSHTTFNSIALGSRRKFKNFWNSSYALGRLSDLICAEHGLSVIKNPKPGKGKSYGEWLGANKKLTFGDEIRKKIDEILPSCTTFENFISALRASGFSVQDKRRHISVCTSGQKRPTRLDTLGGDYTEAAIRARIGKIKIITGGSDSTTYTHISLLVDIQEKIREGKGAGYEQWAKIFNLKQAAKTLIFLQENEIDSYEDLKKKTSSATGAFTALTAGIKEVEARQKEVSELQKYIGQYGKTRNIYAKYKASGWKRSFYDEHATDIILHRAAKNYFDGIGLKKLPSINQLKQEWATLAAEKKKLYSHYRKIKNNSHALAVAKLNADRILGITQDILNSDESHEQIRRKPHER